MRPSAHHFVGRSVVTLALVIAVASCSSGESNEGGGQVSEQSAPAIANASSQPVEVPDREPDVTGFIGLGDEYPRSPHLVDPSDEYYLGMYLLGGDPAVLAETGDPLAEGDLAGGDAVSVWVDGGCDESRPVQCGVVAVRVEN